MTLKPALSAYLDCLRFTAAFSVLLGHMDQDGLSMAWMPLSKFSHDAVVIFFVLSGFIIYYSTTTRTHNWREYVVMRLSRIYSVALPAVLACISLALVLSSQPDFEPNRYSNYSPVSVWHTVSSLLFLNQSWMNEADLTLNIPYWSLCYEVWFYVLFGAWFFTSGWRRVALVAIVTLMAGPSIMLLMPIWLMGAWLAASDQYKSQMSIARAWLAFLGPLVLIVFIKILNIDALIKDSLHLLVPGYWRLENAQRFVTDYLIGAALCLHIASFSSLPLAFQKWFERFKWFWALLAGFSFTLYLFHRPMTQWLGANFPISSGQVLQSTLVALAILIVCWLISFGTEKRLRAWRSSLARLLGTT
jgi:peptidoglycan/LPS O-acetylase OafA/YrhL